MTPKILLSFDVEEFDMPLEYNFNIAIETQMKIGKKGLDNLMPILMDQNYTTLYNFNVANDIYSTTDSADLGWAYNQASVFNITVHQFDP